MSEFRFQLDKENNKQMICPDCNERSFTPYIDNYSGQFIDEIECGICSRLNKCAYHCPPRDYFNKYPEQRKSFMNGQYVQYETVTEEVPVSYIDKEILLNMDSDDRNNNLVRFLKKYFTKSELNEVLQKYFIRFRDEAIIFWQVDVDMNIRTGKMMWYKNNGHRTRHMKLLHKEIYGDDFELQECYFGEHLLSEYPKKDVMIVESEKSCLIASIVYPKYNWISTGGKQKYMEASWPNLLGRNITLIPDQDAIEEWYTMKDEMEMLGLTVSLDERCKNEPEQSDIADIFINQILHG